MVVCCDIVLEEGSGYFSTDYICPICGAEYNMSGQRLASRSKWGEDDDKPKIYV